MNNKNFDDFSKTLQIAIEKMTSISDRLDETLSCMTLEAIFDENLLVDAELKNEINEIGEDVIKISINEPVAHIDYKKTISWSSWSFLVDFAKSVLICNETLERELKEKYL